MLALIIGANQGEIIFIYLAMPYVQKIANLFAFDTVSTGLNNLVVQVGKARQGLLIPLISTGCVSVRMNICFFNENK
mgnify:FL=1